MSRRNPIIEDWVTKFNNVFKFHPDREAIMDRFLGNDPISLSQIDRWWREADEFADGALQSQLQEEVS